MAQKLEAKGVKGGNQWDDLADHDHVTKIYVQDGRKGIQYVKFDYVKNGQPQTGSLHGLMGRRLMKKVCMSIKYDNYVFSLYSNYY